MTIIDRVAQAETAEAEFMFAYEAGTPAPARAELGITTARIGGGVALAMRHDPSGGYWTKALGFGFTQPFTAAVLDEVLGFYRALRIERAVLQLAPVVLPDGFDALAESRGLTRGTAWVKMSGRPDRIADAPGTALRVGPVPPGSARQWASMLLETFGMPAGGLTEMLAATVGHACWRPHAVWSGRTLVAGGNLFVAGDTASLNTAATRAAYRGRGAQSALIVARARAAAEAGCHRLFAETGMPVAGARNASLENMRRAGLAPLYRRDNWIWNA